MPWTSDSSYCDRLVLEIIEWSDDLLAEPIIIMPSLTLKE